MFLKREYSPEIRVQKIAKSKISRFWKIALPRDFSVKISLRNLTIFAKFRFAKNLHYVGYRRNLRRRKIFFDLGRSHGTLASSISTTW